jgi:hypothetical protein
MLITAIRTAMPNVTCGRITLRSPSATADSISTPRFIGPGCMTIASGFGQRQLFAGQAVVLEVLAGGRQSAPRIRSLCSRSITTTSQPASPSRMS